MAATVSLKPHILKNIFLTLLGLALLTGNVFKQTKESLYWGYDDWRITEWVINYSGGFVRRGLPGEFLYWLSLYTKVPLNHLAIGFSLLIFVSLFFTFIHVTRKQFSIFLVCSPVLLGSMAYQYNVIRKDTLGILLLIICLTICQQKWNTVPKLIAVNVVACLAILSHEAFFLYAVPALVIMHFNPSKPGWRGEISGFLTSLAAFLPAIATFALVYVFRGDNAVAIAIDHSLHRVWPTEVPYQCPCAEVAAIPTTVQGALDNSRNYAFNTQLGVTVAAMWAITVAICFIFLIASVGETGIKNEKQQASVPEKCSLATVLVFQFVMIFPLWFLGSDFGRWITLWTMSSAIIYAFGFNYTFPLIRWIYKSCNRLFSSNLFRWKIPVWLLLFFTVPACCWSIDIYILENPIGYYYNPLPVIYSFMARNPWLFSLFK